MQTVTTIGLDIAKSVFQVHGIDAHSKVVVRRQLRRRYVLASFKKLLPCLVGIEACRLTLLVAGTTGTWPHCSLDTSGLREALFENARRTMPPMLRRSAKQ